MVVVVVKNIAINGERRRRSRDDEYFFPVYFFIQTTNAAIDTIDTEFKERYSPRIGRAKMREKREELLLKELLLAFGG